MKTILLDMDGTITKSKQIISTKMKMALMRQECPLIVISGASRQQMEKQLNSLPCTILAQSGNDTPLWQNKLTKKEEKEVDKHIKKVWGYVKTHSKDIKDSIQHRGAQSSLSFVGHNQPPEIKAKFDPDRKIRLSILKKYPFKSKTLVCKVAGTSGLDYTKKNGTKGKNIARWIKENKLNKKDCIFYGDALFKGGNDESVKGVIRCVAVKSPADLLKKLK